MKPAPFKYLRPTSIDEALYLLSQWGDEAKVLAGGQSLVPAMNLRLAQPSALLDINALTELDAVILDNNGTLRIRALTRHQRLEHSDCPGPTGLLLRRVGRHIGHLPVRVRGTFGGSLAHADPAAEWCLLLFALAGVVVARSDGETERRVSAKDFLQGPFMTELHDEELLVEAQLPVLPETAGVGFAQFARRSGDFAIASAIAVVDRYGDHATSATIALGGLGGTPARSTTAESVLLDGPIDARRVAEAARAVTADLQTRGDNHASAVYRSHLATVLSWRALCSALEMPVAQLPRKEE